MFCTNCDFKMEQGTQSCGNCGAASESVNVPSNEVFQPKVKELKIWIPIVAVTIALALIIGALFIFVVELPNSEIEQNEHLRESRLGLPLQNAIEWGLSDDIILDEFLFSSVNDNNTTTKRILFPGSWPKEYFCKVIPEYLGNGYMYILIVTAPSENYTDPNYAEVISLSIYEYCEEDVEIFIEKLFGEGFYETAKEELSDDDRFALEFGFFDYLRRFTTDTTTVRIMRSSDDMGPFLQITVIKNDRIQAREPWREWLDMRVLSFEKYDGETSRTFIHYELTNNYEHNVKIANANIYVNNQKLTIPWVRHNTPGGTTAEHRFAINRNLNPGDMIIIDIPIRVEGYDERGRWFFESRGRAQFAFVVEKIDLPGSSVTNSEHISTHEDITLMITDLDLRALRLGIGQSYIEFVALSPAGNEILLDRIDVYLNGEQLERSIDFLSIAFQADVNSAHRRRLSIINTQVGPGDELTLRGRLSVAHCANNITEETVEFSFII